MQPFGKLIKPDIDNGFFQIEDIELLCQVCRKPIRVVSMDLMGKFDVVPCDHEEKKF